MSLPKPIGLQKEVLYLPANGHTAVLGTAGSGKTTLAILRADYLANQETSHFGRTLLVTFNRALVTYLQYLQEDRRTNIKVETYHTFARGYLASRGRMSSNEILDPTLREELIQKALDLTRQESPQSSLLERPMELFSEEFRWIAQHGVTSVEEYRDVERIGRSDARIQRKDRDLMFGVYTLYKSLRSQSGQNYDWDDLAITVCNELANDTSDRLYKHIVIDEGQDFSPEMIRSLARAIPPDGTLTFFGDVAQQIYGHRMSWRSAELDIKKVWNFQQNYRNSRPIARLGLAISNMPYFQGGVDLVEPVTPSAEGPLPTLVQCTSEEIEEKFIVEQAEQAARFASVAILFRNREDEKRIAKFLPGERIRLHRNMNKWQAGSGIYYGTYHAAKGLEFDMVIMPFCNENRFPDPRSKEAFGIREAMSKDGRLLYVGVTRARIRLLITYTGIITSMLPSEEDLYQKVNQ